MQKISTLPAKSILGKFTYKILGIPFTIYLVNRTGMKQLGQDAYAFIQKDPEPYAVFFDERLENSLIRHEVFHMYAFTTFAHVMVENSAEDMEELAADLFAYRAEEIIKTSNDIKARLEKIKEKN